MFRWLKDRKKHKKGQRSGDANEDHDYGFHAGNKENEDKVYHIYEEIPDLPHFATNRVAERDIDDQSSGFRETSFSDPEHSFDHSSVFNADTLRKYIIGSQDRRTDHPVQKRDGPYMVVPLLNSGEEEKPPLPPPNEKKSEFTCALIGRRHSSLSRSTESGVEVSYDSSESQGSETNFHEEIVEVEVHSSEFSGMSRLPSTSRSHTHVREGSLDTSDTGCEYDMGTSSESDHTNYEYYLTKIEQNLAHKCKIREIIQQCVPEEEESDNESLTTVSSMSCCSSVRAARVPSGHRSTDIDSDEGTLADHSESENSSGYYESFNGSKDMGASGGVFLPVGVDGHVKKELKSCLKAHTQDCPRQHYIKNKKRTVPKKCKHRSVDALGLCIPGTTADKTCKHRSVDALGLCIPGTTADKTCKHRSVDALSLCTSDKSAFKKVNKPRSLTSYGHISKSKDSGINRLYGMSSTSDIDTSAITLDLYEPVEGSAVYGCGAPKAMTSLDSRGREMYSPPPSVRDFTSRTSTLPSKCSMPRSAPRTNVYRSRGSQNRLLSDLIIMNYDRQLFIH